MSTTQPDFTLERVLELLKLSSDVIECKPLPPGPRARPPRSCNQWMASRGLHSSTSQLNLSRVGHKKTPYTRYTPPIKTPLTWATQYLRAHPIPYKALKLS